LQQAWPSSFSPVHTPVGVSGWGKGAQIMVKLVLLGIVTVALLVYLVFALLQPEQF
jgi:K+-transporting ATPase KdpF subunit